MAGNFVVYIIESRHPQCRVFYPRVAHGAFNTKRDAQVKVQALREAYPNNEYRITGYWDKRPW